MKADQPRYQPGLTSKFCQITLKLWSLIDVQNCILLNVFEQAYIKTCLKRPFKKKKKIGFQYQLSLNAGQKYYSNWSILKYFRPSVSYHLSLRSLLAHLSRRLMGELIVYQSLRRPSVRPSVRPSSVRPSTFSNIFSSETPGPIKLKFHMETP